MIRVVERSETSCGEDWGHYLDLVLCHDLHDDHIVNQLIIQLLTLVVFVKLNHCFAVYLNSQVLPHITGVLYDPAGDLLVLHAVTQHLTAWPLCLLVALLWSWQLPG